MKNSTKTGNRKQVVHANRCNRSKAENPQQKLRSVVQHEERGRDQSAYKHLPGENLIDLDVGVSHRHELQFHLANDTLGNEGSEEAQDDVVLVFRHTVVNLDREVTNVRSLPDRNVHVEQPMKDPVNRGADEVATCVGNAHDRKVGTS